MRGSSPTLNTSATLVEHAWCAAWQALSANGVTQVSATPEMLRIMTPGNPDLLLNAVMRYRKTAPVTEADIAQAVAPFQAAGQPWQWWLCRGTEPIGLHDRLKAFGMQLWGQPTGMTLALSAWQAHSVPTFTLFLQQASTDAVAECALQVICEVFGMDPEPMRSWCVGNPNFLPYIAWSHGLPAAALVLQINDGIAGIFHVATLPAFRKRGVARALIERALTDARAAGAHTCALTATDMAESLYQRIGFQACCAFELWMPGPRLMSALHAV